MGDDMQALQRHLESIKRYNDYALCPIFQAYNAIRTQHDQALESEKLAHKLFPYRSDRKYGEVLAAQLALDSIVYVCPAVNNIGRTTINNVS